jgi:hypothetical protein
MSRSPTFVITSSLDTRRCRDRGIRDSRRSHIFRHQSIVRCEQHSNEGRRIDRCSWYRNGSNQPSQWQISSAAKRLVCTFPYPYFECVIIEGELNVHSQSSLYCIGIMKLNGYVVVVPTLIMEEWSLLQYIHLRRQLRCVPPLILKYKARVLEHKCWPLRCFLYFPVV